MLITELQNENMTMKYLFILLLLLIPNMTLSNTNDIQEIVNVNNVNYFSITKSKGAFVSFNVSSLLGENVASMVLSLFLEDKSNAGDISEFLLYPVNVSSKKVGDRGLAIKTSTQKDGRVDFVLPVDIFTTQEGQFGVVIFTNQDSTFLFKGTDGVGTVQDPMLVVEHGEKNLAESNFDISQKFQDEILESLSEIKTNSKIAAVNSEKVWYEKPYFTSPLGLLIGVAGSIIAAVIFRKYF